jgi:hypothetical protein
MGRPGSLAMMVYVTYEAIIYGVRRGKLEYETLSPLGASIEVEQYGVKLSIWFANKDWFKNYKSAIKNAYKQRDQEIERLQKRIEKLKQMEFK